MRTRVSHLDSIYSRVYIMVLHWIPFQGCLIRVDCNDQAFVISVALSTSESLRSSCDIQYLSNSTAVSMLCQRFQLWHSSETAVEFEERETIFNRLGGHHSISREGGGGWSFCRGEIIYFIISTQLGGALKMSNFITCLYGTVLNLNYF